MDIQRKILNCKADQKCEEWTYLVKSMPPIQPEKFTRCSPVDQISQIFKENPKDTDSLTNSLKKLANSYYCLHRYAMNLHGDHDISYYKQIKMYTGYWIQNIKTVSKTMEDEAVKYLEVMGYFYPDEEYKDQLKLSEEDGKPYYEKTAIVSLAEDSFYAHIFCLRVHYIVVEIFRNGYEVDVAKRIIVIKKHFDVSRQELVQLCKKEQRELLNEKKKREREQEQENFRREQEQEQFRRKQEKPLKEQEQEQFRRKQEKPLKEQEQDEPQKVDIGDDDVDLTNDDDMYEACNPSTTQTNNYSSKVAHDNAKNGNTNEENIPKAPARKPKAKPRPIAQPPNTNNEEPPAGNKAYTTRSHENTHDDLPLSDDDVV